METRWLRVATALGLARSVSDEVRGASGVGVVGGRRWWWCGGVSGARICVEWGEGVCVVREVRVERLKQSRSYSDTSVWCIDQFDIQLGSCEHVYL